MATIGLDKLFYAPITEDENGDEEYGTPVMLAKAMTAELSIELNEATLYADDGAAEIVKEFKSGTLSLGVDDIGVAAAEALTGAKIDANGVLISASENDGAPFAVPSTNLTTKGDSIEFSTPTIEGTVMRRNKLDGKNEHPWKAEVNEDDTAVEASVISGWYTEVYEPDYTEDVA